MIRIGYGFDSHSFQPGIPLMLGGVFVPHTCGLAGHSDGDVLLHALTDALLGAIAAGDIGSFFPPSDPKWKGASSVIFLKEAMRLVSQAGYRVVNADATLILQEPKIGPFAKAIRARVADLLHVTPDCVSVKAKTPEGMKLENTAMAHAVVLLEKTPPHDSLLEDEAALHLDGSLVTADDISAEALEQLIGNA